MPRSFAGALFAIVVLTASATVSWAGYTWYRDFDGDGWGDPGYVAYGPYPPPGYVENYEDCDDTNASVCPGAEELCDQVDNDCDQIIDEGCATGVGRLPLGTLALAPPVPNPARSSGTRVSFGLPREAEARLVVLDAAGHHVRTLLKGVRSAGIHSAHWDRRDQRGAFVSSGVYFLRLEALGRAMAVRVAVIR